MASRFARALPFAIFAIVGNLSLGVPTTTAPFMGFVLVGNPGNPPDTGGYGPVSSPFLIGKYEVTNDQFAQFLNESFP